MAPLLTGIPLAIFRYGDPNDSSDHRPYVIAKLNTGVTVRSWYIGDPPPPFVLCTFRTDGTQYVCEGPIGSDVRTIAEDDMAAIPPWSREVYSWTPVVAQGTNQNITCTVNYANFVRLGPMVTCWGHVFINAGGQSGTPITMTAPVNISSSSVSAGQTVGIGFYYDATPTGLMPVQVSTTATTNFQCYRTDVIWGGSVGVAPAIAATNGDQFMITCSYEAAQQ